MPDLVERDVGGVRRHGGGRDHEPALLPGTHQQAAGSATPGRHPPQNYGHSPLLPDGAEEGAQLERMSDGQGSDDAFAASDELPILVGCGVHVLPWTLVDPAGPHRPRQSLLTIFIAAGQRVAAILTDSMHGTCPQLPAGSRIVR
ncbi:hypothetical protein [Amycolatopsis nalaikhensis]|uniref:Uncharacterized protein n=1 Tax=Amycolatopsis nalaikhensis TaxID=715472 RepID=A0ABY8XBU5_9PSEU|nr:hypothetical protein [Amycolatopsis sp. 2-2]WIV52838.1 hypothetical protein QP939_28255 [Amycolatopsis sp. 2-2]